MCSSKSKPQGSTAADVAVVSHINGRPVLQPNCNNRSPLLERRNSLKKSSTTKTSVALQVPPLSSSSPPSPTLKSPRQQPATNRVIISHDPNGLVGLTPKCGTGTTKATTTTPVKKSNKNSNGGSLDNSPLKNISSSMIVEAPGSIAAARREQVAIMQVQRKMRIAHYGRTKSAKYERKTVPLDSSPTTGVKEERRCHFITSNSDPIYIAYHDEEWGVPVHEDKMLFELLVLTGAQVGSDWTTVLKKRQDFRDAFAEFDPEIVSKYSEKKMTAICNDYGIELSQVRGVVDNANRIMEIKKELGSFDKYLWAFVNRKPIATQYKSCLKIPVKTSKSETISKDMVRRGFRLVGPTVIHSFMEAAGLTNDHLINCPRQLKCMELASQSPAQ